MRADLGVYGVLLATGLGAAYWASLPASDGDEQKVAIVALDPKTITEVSYKGKDVAAVATRREDGRYWVAFQKTETPPPPPPADPHAAPGTPPPAATGETKTTNDRFLANEKMDELVAGFNPLNALRVIGKADDKQLDEFGLKDKADSVTVKAGDKTLTYYLGKRSYGSRNRFVLEGGGEGRVLLVDDSSLENLEKANLRLYDRRLVPFDLDDVTAAQIGAGSRTKRMGHTQRDKQGDLQWSEDEDNGAVRPSYNAWMDKISKLRLSAYAEPADEDKLKGVEPFLTLTFEKAKKPLDTVVFKKLAGEPPTYWVQSEFLKTAAKIVSNRVEPIEKDIDTVFNANDGGSAEAGGPAAGKAPGGGEPAVTPASATPASATPAPGGGQQGASATPAAGSAPKTGGAGSGALGGG
jgi:hypothetical protein